MNFDHSEHAQQWLDRLRTFMDRHVYPAEAVYRRQSRDLGWAALPLVDELKQLARAAGLWNLFMPPASGVPEVDETFRFESPGLSNLE
jgi:acyl-CoA dehydrogenase